jgi:predicted AAA+ superfamily ATPase
MIYDPNNIILYSKLRDIYVPLTSYDLTNIKFTPLYYNSLYNCFIYITFYNDGSINLTTNNNFEALHHFIDIIAPTLNNEESKKQQLQIYSLKKDNTSKIISFQSYAYVSPKKIFDTFFFTDKEKIINIVTKFKNNTLYSPNISIDNKIGLFLYGPPGTGKTGLISAIANYLNYDIIIINFQTNYTIPEFDYLFNKNNYTNKIIVFDEIDYLITKLDKYNKDVSSTNLIEQEVKMKSIANNTQELDTHITIEYILSKLDGVEDNNGRIICATTNKHELFEPRFFRPGRFDLVINLNNCTQQMYIDIICNFFSQSITLEDKEYINQIVYPELKYSPTELHNICIQSGDLNSAIKYIIDT